MKSFCTNCGTEIQAGQKHCIECGQPIASEKKQAADVQSSENKQPKEPMPFKKKIMYGAIAAVVILLIAAYSFGKSYYAPEKVLERFETAVKDENVGNVQQYVQFTDGGQISKVSAEAIINFAKKDASGFKHSIDVEGMYMLTSVGKKFGLFEDYKITTRPVSLSINYPFEELTFTINGEDLEGTIEGVNVEGTTEEERQVYESLAPGYYEVEANYEGEYTSFSKTEMLEVFGMHDSRIDIDMDFDIQFVNFTLDHPSGVSLDDMALQVGDKSLEFNANGYIEKVGPFLLDGSQTVTVSNKLPWGDVKTAEIPVTNTEMELQLPFLNEEVQKTLTKIIPEHFEQMVEAKAKLDDKLFTNVTESYRVSQKEAFERSRNVDKFYSGKLLEVQMSFEHAKYERDDGKDRIVLPVWVLTDERIDEKGSSENLDRTIMSCDLTLDYAKDKWLVHDCSDRYSTEELNGVTVEGSKKLHKAKTSSTSNEKDDDEEEKDRSKKKKEASTETDGKFADVVLEAFMNDYNAASVAAINAADYSIVSELVAAGSPREKEQSDYIEYLDSRGITEDHISTVYESSKKIDDTTVEVTTIETFTIHYKDKPSSKKKYRTVNQLKLVDGFWRVHKLVDTKEI